MSMDSPSRATVQQPSISRAAAVALVAAARRAAEEIGFASAVAVVDAGGVLVAFERSDGAVFRTAEIAPDKAWTAVYFQRPTHVLAELFAQAPEVAQLAHRPRVVAVGGGYCVVTEGQLVGGIGVSGGEHSEDMAAAEHALRDLELDGSLSQQPPR